MPARSGDQRFSGGDKPLPYLWSNCPTVHIIFELCRAALSDLTSLLLQFVPQRNPET
jgi:hypothetical protein